MAKIKRRPAAKKTAGNNQWVSCGQKPDSRERRDGPGGEDAR